VVMRLATRTWTQLRGRDWVARQGQFQTIVKALSTGLVLTDTRSTGRYTSALCSFLHDVVGFDASILNERRHVGDKSTKLKVKN
jgi:hypothetical protein